MDFNDVSEITKRAQSIGDYYFETYRKLLHEDLSNRYQREELENDLYHVIHAAEYLSNEELVAESKKDPMGDGCGVVICASIYAISIVQCGELLQEIVNKIVANCEEGYLYPKFKLKHDLKILKKYHSNLLDYKISFDRDYNAYLRSLGKI